MTESDHQEMNLKKKKEELLEKPKYIFSCDGA